jgi:hypothetical protein
MWPDIRLGVIVGAIAIVLGPAAAFLTSTPPTTVGTTVHKVAIDLQPDALQWATTRLPRNDRLEDDRN